MLFHEGLHAALGTDGQHMAGTLAQGCVHAGHKLFQNVHGNEGLDGAGEAAAVDTVSAPAVKVMLSQTQGHGHILMQLVACGNHVLQVHPAGAAALLDQLQEALEIALFQRCHLLGHPGVLLVEVDAAHDGPVAAGFAQLGDTGIEVLLVDLGQDLLAELGGNGLDLAGNGGILVGQVRMVGAGVDDAQGMAGGGEVEAQGTDHGVFLVEEVDVHEIAHGGGHLVHEAAGLAEEYIFGILADHGNLGLGNLVLKEQAVDDGADEHFVGGGGGKAGAGEDGGLAVGIEAFHLAAQLGEPGGNATDQGGGGVDLAFHGLKLGHIHFADGIALGENADGVGAVEAHGGHGVQVHGCCQNPAPLMVGMVAADLGAAGGGEIALRGAAKLGGKARVQSGAQVGIQNKLGCCHKNFLHVSSEAMLPYFCILIVTPNCTKGKWGYCVFLTL